MYVFTEEHIKGHLTVCYQSLLVFQILSKKLDELGAHYSVRAILYALKTWLYLIMVIGIMNRIIQIPK